MTILLVLWGLGVAILISLIIQSYVIDYQASKEIERLQAEIMEELGDV